MSKVTRTINNHAAVHAAWPGQFSIFGLGVGAEIEGVNPPSQAQIDAAEAAAPDPAVVNQIAALEASITPRRIREAVLGTDGGWLANQEALIAAERSKL
jgi:hypothetical protein